MHHKGHNEPEETYASGNWYSPNFSLNHGNTELTVVAKLEFFDRDTHRNRNDMATSLPWFTCIDGQCDTGEFVRHHIEAAQGDPFGQRSDHLHVCRTMFYMPGHDLVLDPVLVETTEEVLEIYQGGLCTNICGTPVTVCRRPFWPQTEATA